MRETRLIVKNTLGLHARAAAQLVRLAGTFKSKITLERPDNGVFANAKSILSLLTLAATKGTELLLTVEGDDEGEAVMSVEALFASGFGDH